MKRLIATTLLLNALFVALLLPRYPWIPWIAADALLLAGLFALWPRGRGKRLLAGAIGALYAVLAFFALSDVLVRQSIGRPFNLYLELGTAGSVFDLMKSNLGLGLALLIILALAIVFAVLGGYVARLLSQLGGGTPARAGQLVTVAGIIAVAVSWLPQSTVGLSAARLTAAQIQLAADTHQSTQAFRQHLEDNPGAGQISPLTGLANTDVILGFIESYGISAVTDARYRPVIGARLDQMGQALADAGLHIVTGRLRSPVQGGQSWLAHTTLLSGQWIKTQLDYEIFLASDFPTLIDDMDTTGHHTVAVMPAITRAWPEGRAFGYNRIYDSSTMDYRGPALNWVTMPDQYTWSWFQRRIRDQASTPLFAELALISSHAPWVPVLPVLNDWDAIGDGEIFNQWKDSGEAPASLWRDTERVREHYTRALDYALNVATGYATRHVDNRTLLVLLGDHQAAPLITGGNASRDVIVHIISADPELLAPFIDNITLPGFGWGVQPGQDREGPTMARFRPFLQQQFGAPLDVAEISVTGTIEN
ncbi:alkaline phosphatase family protein [Marinobacter orientalis]|uniref:Sulfatase n=1 Tax=Marinobacter orientalis TaxID=1928859 RepID=A0A7Y0NK51_9GAMM|nr:hypothetical protein [Marinobacter orientalis]NMT62812.1 hypothetical protein [Marinobacter orientalis]TGX51490.1 hypothetical protein DIT72_05560 [Marinobacter orientalis]